MDTQELKNPFENPDYAQYHKGYARKIREICEKLKVGESAPVIIDGMPYGTLRVTLNRSFKGQFTTKRSIEGVAWIMRIADKQPC